MEPLWHKAKQEFLNWSAQPIKSRISVVLAWYKALQKMSLSQDSAHAQQCVLQLKQQLQYFCLMAERRLGKRHLQGPTGEENTLVYNGRGIYLVADLDEQGSDQAFCQLLLLSCAAIITGNSVIMRYNGHLQHWHKLLLISLHKQLPEDLLQITCSQSMQRLLASQVLAGIASISQQQNVSPLHCQASEGAIRQVNVFDPQQLPTQMLLPDFLLSFSSQVCISNNTAAIGGNAQLLTQAVN